MKPTLKFTKVYWSGILNLWLGGHATFTFPARFLFEKRRNKMKSFNELCDEHLGNLLASRARRNMNNKIKPGKNNCFHKLACEYYGRPKYHSGFTGKKGPDTWAGCNFCGIFLRYLQECPRSENKAKTA